MLSNRNGWEAKMIQLLVVGFGGFIGAVARWGLSGLVQRAAPHSFPVGTLFVNALGCLIIGALMAAADGRQWFSDDGRLFLAIGILGSFTTFSAFGYDTITLFRGGDMPMAMANVGLNLTVGLAAVVGGHMLIRSLVA
jgi:fluoride exporter